MASDESQPPRESATPSDIITSPATVESRTTDMPLQALETSQEKDRLTAVAAESNSQSYDKATSETNLSVSTTPANGNYSLQQIEHPLNASNDDSPGVHRIPTDKLANMLPSTEIEIPEM